MARNPKPAQAAPTPVAQATAPQQQPTTAPVLATPLPANFAATAPSAAASLQAFTAYKLPNSLQAKGASLCGGNLPPQLAPAAVLVALGPQAGRANPRSLHNAGWWDQCKAVLANGPVHASALVAAGVGVHSVRAYLQRGWLATVQAPSA